MLLKLLLTLAAAAELARAESSLRRGGNRRQRLVADERGDMSTALKQQYPWYHTSSELTDEVSRLAADCGGALSVRTVNQSGVSIDVMSVKKPGTTPFNRVFLLFGEHSRELVSPESGLRLLRVLCGDADTLPSAPSVDELLQDTEFQFVLNSNPGSRSQVERGKFCLRTNPSGVDLNRNWDEMWQTEAVMGSATNPGPRAFSEPETQIFRELVTKFEPTAFVTVHSGTRGMYMPWAYDKENLATRNQVQMMKLLRDLDKSHCQCPYGAAGKEVGYSCPGTSLDWVYDKLQTPYSFAFEIYTSPASDRELQARWTSKVESGGLNLLQSGQNLGHPHFLDLFQTHVSDFVQTQDHGAGRRKRARRHGERSNDKEDDARCFGQFNPDTEERYEATVDNWAAVYMEMSHKIAQNLRT